MNIHTITKAARNCFHHVLAHGKALILLAAIACGFLYGGCEKWDTNEGLIEIRSEAMAASHTKVSLDGASATWIDGDSIRINGEDVVVVRQDDRAYIRYSTPQSVNRAIYPTRLNRGSLSSDNVTLSFPAYYHYRADNSGHQLLDLPMAARSENEEPLQFKHLTGALYVTVTNTATIPLTLQSVTVQSNRYQLSGSRSIDLNDLENIGSVATSTSDDRAVTLVFDTGYTLAANASLKVMLPVMPVGGDNRFTIKVKSHADGASTSYLKTQTQPEGGDHSLVRNQLGYAPISIVASGSTSILTYNSPDYEIRTPFDFKLMVDAIQNQWLSNTERYKIVEDIDMSSIPISTITNTSFAGIIDGNNHTINNLTINSVDIGSNEYACALFYRAVASLVVKNIIIEGLVLKHRGVTNNTLKLGGLFAYYEKTSSPNATLAIDNCKISYDNIDIQDASGNINFGGIICEISGQYAQTDISNCTVNTTNISLSGKSFYWGGLISFTGFSKTTISSSSWNGSVNLTSSNGIRLGGFIGSKSNSIFIVSDCTIGGDINVSSPDGYTRYIGSLIGYYYSPASATISNTTTDISFTLNGSSISPSNFGTNP